MKRHTIALLLAAGLFLVFLDALVWQRSVARGQVRYGHSLIDGEEFFELMSFLEDFDPNQWQELKKMMQDSPDELRSRATELYEEMKRFKLLLADDPKAFWRERDIRLKAAVSRIDVVETGKDKFENLVEEWKETPASMDNFLHRAGLLLEWIQILEKNESFDSEEAYEMVRKMQDAYDQRKQDHATKLLNRLFVFTWRGAGGKPEEEEKKTIRTEKPDILVISGSELFDLKYSIEPKYRKDLKLFGYQVDSCSYGDITWEKLKNYNVLVLTWHPKKENQEYIDKVYQPAFPLLMRFLEEGGGIFIMGGSYAHSETSINRFLEPLSAKILHEAILDKAIDYHQRDYLFLDFASTTTIERHPVTSGVWELWYCAQEIESGFGTPALKLGPSWKPLVKGNSTSFSSGKQKTAGTYDTEPPMVACRSYTQGRVVLFSAHPSFWITDPHHPVWEEVCITKGRGFSLLLNIYNWLGEPSLDSGALGGVKASSRVADELSVPPGDIYEQLTAIGFRKPEAARRPKADITNTYSGIIGISSSHSSGNGSVSEYAREAMDLEYDFIVFTEDYTLMTQEKWNDLVSECIKYSGEKFLAIPGLSYKDMKSDNSYIVFGFKQWPPTKCFNKEGKGNPTAISKALGAPPSFIMTPALNPVKPWFQTNYNGLEVVSYSHGIQLITRSLDDYLSLQANTYNLAPIVSHRIQDPEELSLIKNYLNYVRCNDLTRVPEMFTSRGEENPRGVYVSSGPRINVWYIKNAVKAAREEEWRLSLDVSSDQILSEVIIYDGRDIYRVFRPSEKTFSFELIGRHEKQHYFTMVVKDAAGGEVISSCLWTFDIRQKLCLDDDRQNTTAWMSIVDQERKLVSLPTGLVIPTASDEAGGNIMAPLKEIMPQGFEVIPNGFKTYFSPRILDSQNKQESAVARREIVFSSGDVGIIDNYLEMTNPSVVTSLADTRVRLTMFNPRPYSYTMMFVESDITYKKDFSFGNEKGFELITLNIREKNRWKQSFLQSTYFDEEGQKVTRRRSQTVRGEVKKRRYVSVGPDFYGSAAVFPLSDGVYDFLIDGGGLLIGHEMPSWPAAAGDTVQERFLVVRGRPGEPGTEGFDLISKLYGLDGPPAYQIELSHGSVLETICLPVLEAGDYYVEGNISQAPLPNELGLCITKLNSHWDAGMQDRTTGSLRRIGVCPANSTGYLTIDTSQKRSFVIGNLLTCDNSEIRLALLSEKDSNIEIEVHNPLAEKAKVVVKSPFYPDLKKSVSLKPGESQRITTRVKRK